MPDPFIPKAEAAVEPVQNARMLIVFGGICQQADNHLNQDAQAEAPAKPKQKAPEDQQSWVFKATCKLTQQRAAITAHELSEWDLLFGDLFAVLEREGLLGDQQQAVTDAQSHALPRDIASLTQVCR